MERRQPGTYEQGPGVLREIINNDLGDLSSTDKQAIKHASGVFLRYTAFVLGSGLGVMLALRGRYHPTRWRQLPKLFPNGLQGGPNADAVRDRFGQFLKTIAYSAGGVLLGQSVGFALGTWQSSKIIRREGNYENIEKVMKKVQKDLSENYQRGGAGNDPFAPTGSSNAPMTSQQRRKLQGAPQIPPERQSENGREGDFSSFYGNAPTSRTDTYESGENTRLNRLFEKDSSTSSAAGLESPFAKEMQGGPVMNVEEFSSADGMNDNQASGRRQEPAQKRSRWEELRGTRDSKDSAWEKIRQTNARQQLNTNDSRRAQAGQDDFSSAQFGDGYGPTDGSKGLSEADRVREDERKRAAQKAKERREYDKMFEKESRGEDSM